MTPQADVASFARASATPFRTRLRNRERLIGTFIRTVSPHVVDVLGRSGLDCLVLDGEPTACRGREIDLAMLAARAAHCPLLVRVPDTRADTLLEALDLGVAGVLAPRVRSLADATQVVAACRYRDDARVAEPARHDGYGAQALTMPELVQHSDAAAVLCQIDDRDAVDAVSGIAALDGLDCLFIGRADLTRSHGAATLTDAAVMSAIERVCAAGRAAGCAVGIGLPDLRDMAAYEALGVTLFLIGSDQSMLRAEGAALATQFRRDP